MKTTLVLIVSLYLSMNSFSQETIYSYGVEGNIVPKEKFINKFFWENLELVFFDKNTRMLKSPNGNYDYKIILREISEPDNEGEFSIIEISHKDKTLLSLKSLENWDNVKIGTKGLEADYFVTVQLSETAFVLLFFGYPYDSTPILTTIVVVNKESAKLVFNRNCNILSYTNNSREFSIVYTDQIQETNDDGSPYPATSQLKQWKIWKDGDMLKYAQIK